VNEPPRRRRSSGYTPDGRSGGSFPVWPLFIVIVVLGVFIGGVLAHFLRRGDLAAPQKTVRPTPVPVAVATPPAPIPHPERTTIAGHPAIRVPTPLPTAVPTGSPTPRPVASRTPVATAAPTAAPTATPVPKPLRTPAPAATTAPKRHTQPVARKPVSEPPPPVPADSPAGVVRAYINALANGNRVGAQQYLANGTVDQDSFIDASAQITGLRSSSNADGTAKVDVDLATASGKYFISFTLSDNRITDHTAIKP
jgi:hypothetical protein